MKRTRVKKKVINKGEEVIKIMRWVSVKAHYPRENVYVLVFALSLKPDPGLNRIYIMNHMDGFWYSHDTGEELNCQYEIITHWMSLPEHPRIKDLSDSQKLEKATFND